MKNKKLNLDNLEVQSFVTSLRDESQHTIKGGASLDLNCIDSQINHCSYYDGCLSGRGCTVGNLC
jgi:hypothetical protein